MVTSKQEEVLWVLDLVGHQEADDFKILLTSINIVPKEEIVRLRWEVANLEDSEQVNELTMNITRNNKWWVEFNQVWLANEDLLRLLDQDFDLFFGKVHWFDAEVGGVSSNVLSNFKKSVNNIVQFILINSTCDCSTLSTSSFRSCLHSILTHFLNFKFSTIIIIIKFESI